MRLRLSDAASFAWLAEHYRSQAMMCRQMALITAGPVQESWLEFAEEWAKLARDTLAKAALEQQ